MSPQSLHIPERFLRQLWKHHSLRSVPLISGDGRPIRIISPGILNTDAGPDFLDALVKIGDTTFRGDIELHQTLKEWIRHAHDRDARYNPVILHVVFEAEQSDFISLTKSKRRVPVLALRSYLAGSLRDVWEKIIFDERRERLTSLRCYQKNRDVTPDIVHSWLNKLAMERMELKVRRFEERLHDLAVEEQLRVREPSMRYGTIPFGVNPEDLPPPIPAPPMAVLTKATLWSQLLYEGILEALGFSKNREPFLRLARSVRLENIESLRDEVPDDDLLLATESFLFGVAGLLTIDMRTLNAQTKTYVRRLRTVWKTIRTSYAGEVLHPADWKFFRLRPENFPTVRLAGAARLSTRIFGNNLLKSIIQTIKPEQPSTERYRSLVSLFVVPADGFWTTHYYFGHETKGAPKNLVGAARAGEIVINVVLPIALLYARIFKDKDVRHNALRIFQRSPSAGENAITKTVLRQLIHPVYGVTKLSSNSAMIQQGMLQLYNYYCVEERCVECAVGRVIFTK